MKSTIICFSLITLISCARVNLNNRTVPIYFDGADFKQVVNVITNEYGLTVQLSDEFVFDAVPKLHLKTDQMVPIMDAIEFISELTNVHYEIDGEEILFYQY